ncbi:MAG: radical SAM protein [Lachnospiraceae bacterium]|nr:radical SAM protein [Lachnospiraceae bacterium]
MKLERWFQNLGKDPGRSLFCLTSGGNGGDEWLHEVAQLKLHDLGLQDRIIFYDHYKGSLQKYEKPVLGYVEYHVSWHCNLNCKGCAHYCNLNRMPRFGDIKSFRANLLRLKLLFDHVETFTLMGGEPFLNPELGMFALAVRETFPATSLQIITNGLLILKAEEQLLDMLAECDALVMISNYPPTAKILEDVEARLKMHGVRFEVSPPITEFRFEVGAETGDGLFNYSHCCMKKCHFLEDDGCIGGCGAPIFYKENQEYLETKREVSLEDWINIQTQNDGWQLLYKLNKPMPFCRYCITGKRIMFPWQGQYTRELKEEEVSDRYKG